MASTVASVTLIPAIVVQTERHFDFLPLVYSTVPACAQKLTARSAALVPAYASALLL